MGSDAIDHQVDPRVGSKNLAQTVLYLARHLALLKY